MAIEQTVWSLDDKKQLQAGALLNEQELHDLICNNIGLLDENWLVLGSEVTTAGGRIDILCLDKDGDTIVVELKKGMTPREVTAQALDYASCVASMGSDDLANIYKSYAGQSDALLKDACKAKFGLELDEENINQKVKIVIVATEMDAGTERIISYLNQFNIDINILFFHVFQHGANRYLSRAWFRENADLPIQKAAVHNAWNNEYYVSFGEDAQRAWEDAVKYNFISAGGGTWYTNTLQMLSVGDRVWVNIPHIGYVGVGRVTGAAVPAAEATVAGTPFFSLALNGNYSKESANTEQQEVIVPVKWDHTVSQAEAIKEFGFFGNQNTVCRPTAERWNTTVERLKDIWKID